MHSLDSELLPARHWQKRACCEPHLSSNDRPCYLQSTPVRPSGWLPSPLHLPPPYLKPSSPRTTIHSYFTYKKREPCSVNPSLSSPPSPSPSSSPSHIHPIFHQDCKHNDLLNFFFLASQTPSSSSPPFLYSFHAYPQSFSPPCNYLSIHPSRLLLLFHAILNKKRILVLFSYSLHSSSP